MEKKGEGRKKKEGTPFSFPRHACQHTMKPCVFVVDDTAMRGRNRSYADVTFNMPKNWLINLLRKY
jgi:hypothetical protein